MTFERPWMVYSEGGDGAFRVLGLLVKVRGGRKRSERIQAQQACARGEDSVQVQAQGPTNWTRRWRDRRRSVLRAGTSSMVRFADEHVEMVEAKSKFAVNCWGKGGSL